MIIKSIEYASGKYVYAIGHYKPNGNWSSLVQFNDLENALRFYSVLMGGHL